MGGIVMRKILFFCFLVNSLIFSHSLAAFKLSAEMIKELDQYFSEEHLAAHRKEKADCVDILLAHQRVVHTKDDNFRKLIKQLAALEKDNGIERSGCVSARAYEKLLDNLYWEMSLDMLTPYLRTKIAEQEKIQGPKRSLVVEDVTDPKDNTIVQMPLSEKGKKSLEQQKLSALSKYEIYRRIFNYYEKTPMSYSKTDEENSAFVVYVPKPVNGMWHMIETKLSDISRWELYSNLYSYYQALSPRK